MRHEVRKPNVQEQGLKKKALSEAEECRARLLVKQPFVGMLAVRMDLVMVADSRLATACTDGAAIFFNADFFMSLNEERRVYLLAHEIWHCVFQHFRRRGNRDPRKFNYAADLEVDFMLEEQGFEVFDLLEHESSWRGKSAEQIYELLADDVTRPPDADQHLFEDTAIPDIPDPGEDNTGQSQGAAESDDGEDDSGSSDVGSDRGGRKKSDSGYTGQRPASLVVDPDYVPAVSSNTGKRWRQLVISVAQQIERTKGSLPAYLKQLISDQYQPQLSWREILQQFVSYCFGGARQWLPPNRRHISSGLYLPSRKDDYLSVTIAIDTSGSTMHDLPEFLAELKGIVSSFGRYDITMIECDASVQNVRFFSEWEPFEYEEVEFKGFGGTSFKPVFDYIDEHVEEPRLLIYLTDGYGDAPGHAPQYPVLWVLTSDGQPPADWGWKAWLEGS